MVYTTDAKIEEAKSKPSRKVGETWTDPHTGMEFVWVPGGCFQMGDIFGNGGEDEQPVHEVCIDGFWIGKYPVTQGLWMKVMDNNPSYFKQKGLNHPVEQVSWHDVQEFINIMNSKSSTIIHRLPTEAEWEYAARSGGKKEKYAGGNDANSVAWYRGNSEGLFWKSTQPVGTKAPNGLGIYDMSGNVWEWVSDWYGGNYYSVSPRNNPQGPSRGIVWFRVSRGGCSSSIAHYCRTARRRSKSPDYLDRFLGFRLALSPGQ